MVSPSRVLLRIKRIHLCKVLRTVPQWVLRNGASISSKVLLRAPCFRVSISSPRPHLMRTKSGVCMGDEIVINPTSHCELVPNTFTLIWWVWGPSLVAIFLSVSILPGVELPGGRVSLFFFFFCKKHHPLVRVFVLLRRAPFSNTRTGPVQARQTCANTNLELWGNSSSGACARKYTSHPGLQGHPSQSPDNNSFLQRALTNRAFSHSLWVWGKALSCLNRMLTCSSLPGTVKVETSWSWSHYNSTSFYSQKCHHLLNGSYNHPKSRWP